MLDHYHWELVLHNAILFLKIKHMALKTHVTTLLVKVIIDIYMPPEDMVPPPSPTSPIGTTKDRDSTSHVESNASYGLGPNFYLVYLYL